MRILPAVWALCLVVLARPVLGAGASREASSAVVAEALLLQGKLDEVVALAGKKPAPALALLAARAQRAAKRHDAAVALLTLAAADPALRALVDLERGLVALARGQAAAAVLALVPLLTARDPAAEVAVLPLAAAWPAHDPGGYLAHHHLLEQARPKLDADARGLLLQARADAFRRLGDENQARATEKQRYLEEPVSRLTPDSPPAGVSVSAKEALGRAEVLLAAHRNERVVSALGAISDAALTPLERCHKYQSLGAAYRKLREYAAAETELDRAMQLCTMDEDRHRRAAYLHAKVVSIRDGLRAVPLIEAFAKRYDGHTMVDDVLFWAGDLYQRRARKDEAEAYFRRITELPVPDDQCAEARWRLAWMAYRRGDVAQAEPRLRALLEPGACETEDFDVARAHYWLARVAMARGDEVSAETELVRAFEADVLGYYAQLAYSRLEAVAPARAAELAVRASVPPKTQAPQLCEGALASEPRFVAAKALLVRGLRTDAARSLLAITVPTQVVVDGSHAAATGKAPRLALTRPGASSGCDESTPRLLLALLLDEAGAYKDAHWRLRTDFAAELSQLPDARTVAIWRAAYPLAYRDLIGEAEADAGLPEFFLQALAREESAFDHQAVSWAGAYGLTQLLLSTAQDAGRSLRPPAVPERGEDLLVPEISARLGATTLARMARRYRGNLALTLAAYNAGMDVARTWWKRHHQDGLDVLGEDMTIQETRGYVKRVLRTFGIYRWLYDETPPRLPIDLELPALGG